MPGPAAAADRAPAAAPTAFTEAAQLAPSSAFAQYLESKYVDPDRVYSTDVRWWMDEAANTDESLLEEIQALYDGGFRGVELCMRDDNAAPNELYAYGSEMWDHKWKLIMNKLLDLGMGVYLTSGTNWSTSNVPGLDPASQAAMQNLTLGTALVAPGASITTLPAPATNVRKAGASYVGIAYAYRIVNGDTVDINSYVDLKDGVTQGADVWTQNRSWTAPADGTYRVFAIWTEGTYQASSPSTLPSYATNYFDTRGVDALKAFWQAHYLNDPVLNDKILHGDVQLFMDSLEISGAGSVDWSHKIPSDPRFTLYSEDMIQQFQARKGYDIRPYLFLIHGVNAYVYDAYMDPSQTGTYRLDGNETLRVKIIQDWQDVQTQLYEERMLVPLKNWLNSIGIKTRAQISYGRPLEISEPIQYVDYPEAENYNQVNQIDLLRLWTGGAKLENKVLSTETGAAMPGFAATPQADLRDAYTQYAVGFQRIVWHIWGSGYSYGSYQWPGHNATSFRQVGTRHPFSATYDEFNAHLGRAQQLLRTGKSRTDVGFIKQEWISGMSKNATLTGNNAQMNWMMAHQGIYYRSTELQNNGYTYDYFSPRFLFDPNVSFDETTKTIEPAGYKAIVIFDKWLDVTGAQRLLDWAKKGLPVVVIGNIGAASQTPFNDGKEAQLQQIVADLEAQPTVRVATVADPPADYYSNVAGGYNDNVMAKLQELGVYPYTAYDGANLQLLDQTRVDDQGNQYVYLYNYGDSDANKLSNDARVRDVTFGTNITTSIVEAGQFIPYQIDAWTGKVTELANYKWENGKTIVPISLDYNNIALLAFEKVAADQLHVVSTNADAARVIPAGIAARTTKSGTITSTLSNGKQLSDNVAVPAPYDITNWDLTVQSWRPNATAGDLIRTETIDGITTVNKKTSTVITPISVTLPTLTTWDKIPEIGKNVSGTGHYEATFSWDANAASGAYLDFGDAIEASAEVWVNGQKVGGQASTNPTKVKRDVGGVGKPTIDDGKGNQVPNAGKDLYTGGLSFSKPIVDISPYLVNGANTISIDYYSALSNVQLSRGIGTVNQNYANWWKVRVDYLSFGPKQARIVPFVDVQYGSRVDVSAAPVPITQGNKVFLSFDLTNLSAVPVDLVVTTPYGTRTYEGIRPGKTMKAMVNTSLAAVPANHVTVVATGVVGGQRVTATETAYYAPYAVTP